MRNAEPSVRWYRKWQKAFGISGGHLGPRTLEALWPRGVELYRLGASAVVAGSVCAREYQLHSSLDGWKELAAV